MANDLVKQDWQVTLGGKPVAESLTAAHFISQEMQAEVESLSMDAECIVEVKSKEDDAEADKVMSAITKTFNQVEELRTGQVRPFNAIVDKINGAVKGLVAGILGQKARLSELRRGWQLAEAKRIGEERRKADEEARKLQEEAVKLETEKARAIAAGDTKAQEAAQLQQQVLQKKAAVVLQAPPEAPKGFWTAKVNGNTMDEINASLLLLANAKPGWVKITPDIKAIRAALKGPEDKKPDDVPGVTIMWDVQVRSGR